MHFILIQLALQVHIEHRHHNAKVSFSVTILAAQNLQVQHQIVCTSYPNIIMQCQVNKYINFLKKKKKIIHFLYKSAIVKPITINITSIQVKNVFKGHEAFSSLVDVAVQQPLLPVPHKEEKRQNVPVSEPTQHHEMRYHPHIGKFYYLIHIVFFLFFFWRNHSQFHSFSAAAHEQMAMIHQQQMRAVEIQRRHQQQILSQQQVNFKPTISFLFHEKN